MELRARMAGRHANWLIAVIAIECALTLSLIHSRGLFTHAEMDFLPTYTAARMLTHGDREQLYDTRAQWEFERPIIARYNVRWDDRVMHPYTTPPLLAVAGIPLLLLSPAGAALVWSLASLLAIGYAARLLARALALDGPLALAFIVGSFPAFYIAFLGQLDGLLFLAFTAFIVELRAGRETRAGLALSLLVVKPHLLPAALVYLVATGRKRAFVTTLASGLAQGLACMALVGRSGIEDYVKLSRRLALPTGDAVSNVGGMVNFRGMLVRAFPDVSDRALMLTIAVLTALTLLAAGWLWRRAGEGALSHASLALLGATTVLTAYHSLYHTAILAVLAALLLIHAFRERGDALRAHAALAGGLLFFAFGPLLLFMATDASRMPAMLTSVGVLFAWGCAAYLLAQPQPLPASLPRLARSVARPRAWTE